MEHVSVCVFYLAAQLPQNGQQFDVAPNVERAKTVLEEDYERLGGLSSDMNMWAAES